MVEHGSEQIVEMSTTEDSTTDEQEQVTKLVDRWKKIKKKQNLNTIFKFWLYLCSALNASNVTN